MTENFENFEIRNLSKIQNNEFDEILNLILIENPGSILASLSRTNIRKYLEEIIKSKKLDIFVVKKNNTIIAYAITAERVKYLISIISNMKFKIFIDLLFGLRFFKIANLVLAYLKIDLLFLSKQDKEIINSNYNLNLLAVRSDFQSKGLGSFFLKEIFKKIKSSNYISVESIDDNAYRFYVDKHKFLFLGKKLRIKKNLKVLYKKLL